MSTHAEASEISPELYAVATVKNANERHVLRADVESESVELPFRDIVQRLANECDGPNAFAHHLVLNAGAVTDALVARGWKTPQIVVFQAHAEILDLANAAKGAL